MKIIKNDTRYIIKRVICAVLIVLIVGNLKQCKVHAESIEMSNISASNGCTESLLYDFDIGSSNRWYCSSFTYFNPSNTLSYSNTNLYYDTYNIKNYANVGSSYFNLKYFVLYDSTNDYYIIQNSNQSNYSGNVFNRTSQNDYFSLMFNSSGGNVVPSTIISKYQMSFSSSNNLYNSSSYNGLYSYNVSYININDIDLSHLYIYDTNIQNLSITIDNVSLSIYSPDPLADYSEINLTDDQSVYFVPKDYNNVPLEQITDSVSNVDYSVIDFNFYYIGSIKEGFFPLINPDALVFTYDIFNSSDTLEYVDRWFPAYEYYSDQSGYQYYAYMIFNNYKNTTIYYNSVYFNAYIVEDMSNYSKTISFIDRNNNSTSVDINFNQTLQDKWESGFSADNSTFNGSSNFLSEKLSPFFEFLTLPFNWLKSIPSLTCSAISIPIPFLNSSFVLPCFSSIFSDVLGDTLYNIIFYIINGLLIYRISISNISVIKNAMSPSDDKLEVLDL